MMGTGEGLDVLPGDGLPRKAAVPHIELGSDTSAHTNRPNNMEVTRVSHQINLLQPQRKRTIFFPFDWGKEIEATEKASDWGKVKLLSPTRPTKKTSKTASNVAEVLQRGRFSSSSVTVALVSGVTGEMRMRSGSCHGGSFILRLVELQAHKTRKKTKRSRQTSSLHFALYQAEDKATAMAASASHPHLACNSANQGHGYGGGGEASICVSGGIRSELDIGKCCLSPEAVAREDIKTFPRPHHDHGTRPLANKNHLRQNSSGHSK
ncbi:hypothetical protein ZIOFF_024171 [Zingiber officinale]|uniref:Uncharacterized protein n=1 Tax=Zingiber officinale TaxID=94328 RepID=A0A8J5H7S0_ZINOF|nr:hypothetical protein ZIOFF_024171 [Zingiber officinale]